MTPELSFDIDRHEYRLDGHVIPSVTQVLEDCRIVDYSYIPWTTRTMALDRGSKVHVATQLDDDGMLDEETLSPVLYPYVQAWRRFRSETGFEPSLVEYRSFHKDYRYGGTLDRTGSFGPTGAMVLLDIKTNNAEWWVRLQLAAYAAFFDGPRKYRRICVELHADETYRQYEFQSRDWADDFNGFLNALSVWNLKRKYDPERNTAAA